MTYAELGGQGVTAAYSEALGSDCSNCGAKMGELCTNPITGKPRKMPCAVRIAGGSSDQAPTSSP